MTAPAVELRDPVQLPGVSRETAADLVGRVRDLYADAETRLAADIARRLAAGMDRPDWAERKLAQAAAMRTDAERLLSRLATDASRQVTYAVVSAFMRGGDDAARALVQLGALDHLDPFPDAAVRRILDGPESMLTRRLTDLAQAFPAAGAMMRLAGALVMRVTGTHLPVLRWAEDAYRRVISEAALSDVAGGLATRRVASQRAWARLLGDGIRGFTDRAGRNWNLASYVEMATRTGVAQAAVEGHMDRLASAGVDLVIVSNAPQECERCRPWEGKVLARGGPAGRHTAEVDNYRTGRTNKIEIAGSVDEAISKGLMHPNCRHSLSAYLHGATRVPTNTEDPEGDAARQRLRELERRVRKEKLKAAAAIDSEAAKVHARKARAIQGEIRDHVSANEHLGIFRKREREQLNLGNSINAEARRGQPAQAVSDFAKALPGTSPAARKAMKRLDAATLESEQAQSLPPIAWQYGTRKLSRGAEHHPDRKAIEQAMERYVYDKIDHDDVSFAAEPRVNSALNGRIKTNSAVKQDIDALDTAMAASKLPRDLTLFRGISNGRGILPGDWQQRNLTGVTWTSRGFTSTSADRDGAETYAGGPEEHGFAMRLLARKGMGALSIYDSNGGLDDEGEIVLPRGLRFRIVADHGVLGDFGVRWVDVEIVSD